jgi:hypothetical protein
MMYLHGEDRNAEFNAANDFKIERERERERERKKEREMNSTGGIGVEVHRAMRRCCQVHRMQRFASHQFLERREEEAEESTQR